MTRSWLGVAVLFVACQSPQENHDAGTDAGVVADTDAGVYGGFDAGPPPHVWFENSDRIEVTYTWNSSYPVSQGGFHCRSVTHAELTQAQTDYLSALKLLPFVPLCGTDGYFHDELKVFDLDGGVESYIDNACPSQPDAGPKWMLPDGVFDFFQSAGTSCGDNTYGPPPAGGGNGGGSGSPLGGGSPTGGGGPVGGGSSVNSCLDDRDAGTVGTGAPGAHVWFATSTRVRVSNINYQNSNTPGIYVDCREVTRDQLSTSQEAQLSALTLTALSADCSGDTGANQGDYIINEISVFDADGGSASYRSTGCPCRGIPGATSQFERGISNYFMNAGVSCP